MVFFQKERQKSLDKAIKTKIALNRQFVFYGFERGNINSLIKYIVKFTKYIDCRIAIMRLNIKIFLLIIIKNIGGKAQMNERKSFQSITQKEKIKSKNGITLIALVISIIVMLILAGVSLNATIGDNGIITQAQNTKYTQSVATIQEYLNQFYIEYYDELQNTENKAEALANYSKSSNWFFKTANGYIVDKNGKAHYFLKTENLPDEVKSQIVGGTSTGKTYGDYINGIDVYGVTKNLEVYYFKDGIEDSFGTNYANLPDENPTKEIFSADSQWAKLVNGDGEQKALTLRDMKDITTLEINENSNISSFAEIYNFTSLKKLTLKNVNMQSIDGLDNVRDLQYLYLKNVKIEDYSAIKKLTNLKYLYVERNGNTEEIDNLQVEKMLDAMAGVDYTKLNYFGIFGVNQIEYYYYSRSFDQSHSSKVTNISKLANLTQNTKNAIKYLNLNNNSITDFSYLNDFKNIYILRIESNYTANLDFLKAMTQIQYLTIANNKIVDTNVFDSSSFNSMVYLNATCNNELINCVGLNKLINLKQLYLDTCSNLSVLDVESIADFYNSIQIKTIDTKYADYLQGSLKRIYDNKNLSDNSEQILALKNMSIENKLKVKQISLVNNKNLSDKCLNELLSSGFKNLISIDLTGCSKLTNLDFLSNITELKELLINNTNVTGDEVEKLDLYCNNLCSIDINTAVNLTKMQKTISNMYNAKNSIQDEALGKKIQNKNFGISAELVPQLEDCTELTTLFTYLMQDTTKTINLIKLKKLERIALTDCGTKFILPENVKYLEGQNFVIPDITNCIDTLETIRINQLYKKTKVEDFEIMCQKLKNSTSLKSIAFTPNNDFDFSSLKYLSGSSIESIQISRNPAWFGTFEKMKNLDFRKSEDYVEGTPHFNNLKTVILEYTGMTNLDAFKDCTNLVSLTITNSKITDISGLENCTKIQTLNLANNSISNLRTLNNKNSLYTLNLNNNSIYNNIFDSKINANVNNIEIIKNLNTSGNLKNIYLLNNKIDDYAELNKLSFNIKEW